MRSPLSLLYTLPWGPSIFACYVKNLTLKKARLHMLLESLVGAFSETCCYVPLDRVYRLQMVSSIFHNIFWQQPRVEWTSGYTSLCGESFCESGQWERISLGDGRGANCLLLCQVSFLGADDSCLEYLKTTNCMRSECSFRLHHPGF